MIFRRTQTFKEGFERLEAAERNCVKDAFKLLEDRPNPPFHNSLRIRKMRGQPGIWEGHVTKSIVFTFEYSKDPKTGKTVMVFHKIGRHAIYRKP